MTPNRLPRLLLAPLLLALAPAVATAQAPEPGDIIHAPEFAAQHPTFDTYWYQGLAELDHYALQQSRYGEIHPGDAVLIFVTEDFDDQLQVKWDHGPRTDVVPVMKLNAYRHFYTGIYPYSILTSVFVPVQGEAPNPLKLSFGSQEWCGNAYTQLNLRQGQYQVDAHSYFQSEADEALTLPESLVEDDLFVRVRRDPDTLPTGELTLLPSLAYLRLMHQPLEARHAVATLEDVASSPYADTPARLYTLTYSDTPRTVRIWFEPQFPNRILAWEEEEPALFNPNGGEPEVLTTRAVLTQSIMLDYWTRHDLDDAAWRDVLGMMF